MIQEISPLARVDPTAKIWHFVVILSDAYIGPGVSIGSFTEIGRGCIINAGTRIGSQCFFPPNSYIGKNVFIGPGVRCADDKHPRVNNPNYKAEPPIIEDDSVIGLGAVLLPGVRIGRGALIGAGSVVTKDVPAGEVWYGEPARMKQTLVT